ncbi:endo-1,4-beta-xylanase [Cellulosilyticum ruminicola]|uniref:endo-1,4-beta-xylanase n=1 Tax=Cellulosilyticum ruminicola TaxID=425254 RepID=UPI0006D2C6AE|nr:endo-1,4-beta-xylanase [Cellulosilyticum ruminicola]
MKVRYFTKKLFAVLTACIMVSSICTSMTPLLAAEAKAEYGAYIYDDFETEELNGWGNRGTGDTQEIVELSIDEHYTGSSCIKVSNRSETWHGATCDKSKELTLGETYEFSVAIKYTGNYSNTQNFSLQLQYNDGVDDQYRTIKSQAVNKGQWTILKGEYTIPTDATNVSVYVETQWTSNPSPQDLMDFYIDAFEAKPASIPEIEQDIPGLKDVFAPYDLILGGAAEAKEIAPKPGKELFLKHYNSITFGNELKPDSTLDRNATLAYMEESGGDETNPQISLRSARTLLEFARDNNLPVRGHTLVWHSQTPDWFFKEGYSDDANAKWVSKEVMLQRMENYIKNLMEALANQYPTVKFYTWDVVNEAVDPDTSDGMRRPGSNNVSNGESAWMKTIGKDYIVRAFEYARKYAPEGCKLFYNDYNEYEDKKMNYIYDILKDLKEKDLIDGMGMQSHWIMQYPSIDMFEKAVKKYSQLGLEIQLTELDIKNPDNTSYALNEQAKRYKQIMNKVMELKKGGANITAVVLWGVTDITSWLGGYPLLFDGEYKAKPAYYSLIEDYKDSKTPGKDPANVSIGVDVKTTVNGNSASQRYTITSNKETIDVSKLKIVYTADSMPAEKQNFWCDNGAIQYNTAPWYVSVNHSIEGKFENGALQLL